MIFKTDMPQRETTIGQEGNICDVKDVRMRSLKEKKGNSMAKFFARIAEKRRNP